MVTVEETKIEEEKMHQETTLPDEPKEETTIEEDVQSAEGNEIEEKEDAGDEKSASTARTETPTKTSTKKNKLPTKETPKSTRHAPRIETDGENEEAKPGIYDKPLIVEGKRERTKVTHFAATMTPKADSPKLDTNAGKGVGMALGDVAAANEYITKKPIQDLKKLHKLLYLREGQATQRILFKKALRKFNGWWFPEKSDEWNKRVAYLQKLKVAEIKKLRVGVGLHHAARTRNEEIENLMHYLIKPTGKSTQMEAAKKEKVKRKSQSKIKMPAKKRKTSKKSDNEEEESEDQTSDTREKKVVKKATPKKAPTKATPKKAKAKVEDSDEEMEEKAAEKGDSDRDDSSESGENKKKDEKEETKNPSDSFIEDIVRELLKTFDLSPVDKQGIMLACDIINEKRFENIKNWIRNIEEHASQEVERVIIGNKYDMEERRAISRDQGQQLTIECVTKFMETSVKANHNIEDILYPLTREIKGKMERGQGKTTGVGRMAADEVQEKKNLFSAPSCTLL